MSDDQYARPTNDEVRAKIRSGGSKAGRNDYVWSPTFTNADSVVLLEAMDALEEKEKRKHFPLEEELVQLRDMVRLAQRYLANPTSFYTDGGKSYWEELVAKVGL